MRDIDIFWPIFERYYNSLRRDENGVYHDDLLNVSYHVKNGKLEVIDSIITGGINYDQN